VSRSGAAHAKSGPHKENRDRRKLACLSEEMKISHREMHRPAHGLRPPNEERVTGALRQQKPEPNKPAGAK
jgi:hypothetical protein